MQSFNHYLFFMKIEKETIQDLYQSGGYLIFKNTDGEFKVALRDKLEFYECEFHNNFTINTVFENKVVFQGCSFNTLVNLSKCTFKSEVVFNDSKFNNKLDFANTNFKGKVRFHRVLFHKTVEFKNTTFNDLADFYQAHFISEQQFHLTDFLNITIFSEATFENQVQFLHNKIDTATSISFQNTTFKKSLDISRANFWCNLSFWDAKIKDTSVLSSIYVYDSMEYDFDKQKLTNDQREKAYKKLRESMRIVKQSFKKENNNIEALEYNEKEISLYRKELKVREIKREEEHHILITTLKILRKYQDRFILSLNRWSNRYGTSWGRGLFFTLIITLIFYSIFLYNLNLRINWQPTKDDMTKWLRYGVEFFNITHWKYKPFGIPLENQNTAYIILFIGRLFISYGIYQTVQAFRKYANK